MSVVGNVAIVCSDLESAAAPDEKSAPDRARLARVDLVVVVHRDAPGVVARSMRSLAVSMGSAWDGRVVLVLNDAPDSTAATAKSELVRLFPAARVLCVSSARNVGFAGGVNLGVTHTTAPYVGVFNPDGVSRPETVARLAAALEQDPNAFMAGARVVPAVPSEAPPAEDAHEANWLPGTAALYRRELFVAIGGFDPGFFMYCEDVDLSRRVRAHGWTLLLVPDASFAHARGFSRVESMRRIRMWTVSNTCLVYQYGVPRRHAMARLARQRARWFRDLARRRRGWTLAGALWGSASWLASIPRLEHRRRHPWDRVALAEWLAASTSAVHTDELN